MLNAKLPELIIEISERLRSNIDDYWADVETDDETKNPLWELRNVSIVMILLAKCLNG